jgi:hypothetical protein
VTGNQLLIVLDVVRERWAQPAHGDDDDPHAAILIVIWRIQGRPSVT